MTNVFVNRDAELKLIDESVSALVDGKRLLRTPIIEVWGTGGIGKTSLLEQVKLRCNETQLPYIWVDVSQSAAGVEHAIMAQVQKCMQSDTPVGQSPVDATKVLLEKGPIVMLFDCVETASAEQLSSIEALLGDLIDDEKLFVILASKKILLFQHERSVARKLTTLSLQPLNRDTCNDYLNSLNPQFDSEVRELLFEWTRGYPLAMSVLVQAMNDGVDIRTEEGKLAAMALFKDRLIDQEVLSNVRPEEREMYFSLLQLFSVPRRFNLVLMQDLIEHFLPRWKRNSSLAYFSLPREIGETTTVLSWNMQRAGFCIDPPIRNIFLLLFQTGQPELYSDVHHFLAQINMQRAREVSGSDRVRYVRECLYHIACDASVDQKEELLLQALHIALQGTPETVLHFSEEFSQDEELKEELGTHLELIQSTIDAHLNGMR